MPHFWDYFARESPKHRKLQDGLFQIASQTCNLLVQVNNTNNISYGNNATNIHCNTISPGRSSSSDIHQDQEQLLVLIPPTVRGSRFKTPSTLRKPRLSTVLEGSALGHEEEGEFWHQGYIVPSDHDGSPVRKWGNKGSWCRPSCIPISIILVLIFLVVLLPLLDHATERALESINVVVKDDCQSSCKYSLVESIPIGLVYPNNTIKNPSTYDTWLNLINSAQTSIEIASFYWTLLPGDVSPTDNSSQEGERIFEALLQAGTARGITLKIAQNAPTQNQPNLDTEMLVKRKAAEVRSLNFAQLMGGGVLHTKLWIIDRKHFYVGSANMDWRALTQVKEMGIVVHNCTCLTEDIGKIFDVYWELGQKGAKIPVQWPSIFETKFNIENPVNVSLNNHSYLTYISSSPPPFCPKGRANDVDAILDTIHKAEKFIYVAVMDYFPLTIYTPKIKFWPQIDNAIRAAALENKVKVKMLISWWNHSRPSEDHFLRSLADLSQSYKRVSIEIRRFIVPGTDEQMKIPFARVNHNKYMVTDNIAYIGTSNWSGDYFTDTGGIGFIVHETAFNKSGSESLRSQLESVFIRDWNSNYSHPFEW